MLLDACQLQFLKQPYGVQFNPSYDAVHLNSVDYLLQDSEEFFS